MALFLLCYNGTNQTILVLTYTIFAKTRNFLGFVWIIDCIFGWLLKSSIV